MGAPVGWRQTRYLTVSEAASVAGISRSRFYEMTQAGEVPGVVLDDRGRQRIRPTDLQRWMEHTGQGAATAPDLFTAQEVTRPGEVHAPAPGDALAEAGVDPATPREEPPPAPEAPEPVWDPEVARRGLADCRAVLAARRRPS